MLLIYIAPRSKRKKKKEKGKETVDRCLVVYSNSLKYKLLAIDKRIIHWVRTNVSNIQHRKLESNVLMHVVGTFSSSFGLFNGKGRILCGLFVA